MLGVPGSKVTVAPSKPFSLVSLIPSPSLSNQTVSPIEPKFNGATVSFALAVSLEHTLFVCFRTT